MKSNLTYNEQQRLRREAVTALSEWRANYRPETAEEVAALSGRCRRAITDAVVRGDQSHTVIAIEAGVSGLQTLQFIDDVEGQARALAAERHESRRYQARVADAMRTFAARHVAAYGDKTRFAQLLNVTRGTLDRFLDEAKDADREFLLGR
jgi:hypothetical protein